AALEPEGSCPVAAMFQDDDAEKAEEADKGALNYQESKDFNGECFLINVYDNTKKRAVTFEVYGLDTQDTLHLQYTYQEFDGLFRFNAELMNPNRKDGRFHWVAQRLGIAAVGKERKLKLNPEPTEEVPMEASSILDPDVPMEDQGGGSDHHGLDFDLLVMAVAVLCIVCAATTVVLLRTRSLGSRGTSNGEMWMIDEEMQEEEALRRQLRLQKKLLKQKQNRNKMGSPLSTVEEEEADE
ncbi:unnamed protein product, partial [Polarella glacialis]